jgi:hypothetical protein
MLLIDQDKFATSKKRARGPGETYLAQKFPEHPNTTIRQEAQAGVLCSEWQLSRKRFGPV